MEQLIDEKTTTRDIQELKSSELHALRNDLRAMTMENQAVSNEASTSNQERNGLLARVETMQIRLTNALEEIETSTFFEKRGLQHIENICYQIYYHCVSLIYIDCNYREKYFFIFVHFLINFVVLCKSLAFFQKLKPKNKVYTNFFFLITILLHAFRRLFLIFF